MTTKLTTPKNVMLIDDDEVVRTLLKRVLTTAGYHVEECSGVKEALAALIQSHPHLIILDLNMPERDGFDFLRIRQKTSVLGAIPLLVLSGTKKSNEIQLALELGADQFVEKPFESRMIIQKIKYIFNRDEKAFYKFSPHERAQVRGEIQATIVESSTGNLKVDSQVRFRSGKPLTLYPETITEFGLKPFVCRVENKFVEIQDGFFRAVIAPTGFDSDEKKLFEKWQRKILK